MRPIVLVSSLLLSCASACAAGEPSSAGDVEPTEQSLEESSSASYFAVTRRDVRKCATPFCGGWFVKLVNRAETRCADGALESECYVSEIDLERLGLSEREAQDITSSLEQQRVLVEGRMVETDVEGVRLGRLVATSAWLGASGSAPTGTFYRAADNGIRCVQAPCPSTTAWTLNTEERRDVTDVILDRTAAPADASKLKRAQAALATKEGILIAGTIDEEPCTTARLCPVELVASELYLRVVAREGKPCQSFDTFDCNDQQYCRHRIEHACGAADATGVCEYKPTVCTRILMPVCGCDGRTYPNECVAAGAGVSVALDHRCPAPKDAPSGSTDGDQT